MSEKRTYFGDLLYTRRVAQRFAHPGEWWSIMHSGASKYESFFKSVLEGESFTDIIQTHNTSGTEVLGLDLMGHGHVLRDLGIQGVAVALGDNRTIADRTYDENSHSALIPGDILLKSTWREVSHWLQEHTLDHKFSIIFCKPQGGLGTIPENPHMTFFLFEQLYNILSNNDGVLLAEIPDEVREYVPLLNQIPGLSVKFHRGLARIKLVKHKDAPAILPKLI